MDAVHQDPPGLFADQQQKLQLPTSASSSSGQQLQHGLTSATVRGPGATGSPLARTSASSRPSHHLELPSAGMETEVCEIAVHLKDFRNVDLFHQGLYRVHVQVYYERYLRQHFGDHGDSYTSYGTGSRSGGILNSADSSSTAFSATAGTSGGNNYAGNNYANFGGTSSTKNYNEITHDILDESNADADKVLTLVNYASVTKLLNLENLNNSADDSDEQSNEEEVLEISNLIPSTVFQNTEHNYGTYLSKAFLIRYCEEEVELNEGAVFRLELPANVDPPEQGRRAADCTSPRGSKPPTAGGAGKGTGAGERTTTNTGEQDNVRNRQGNYNSRGAAEDVEHPRSSSSSSSPAARPSTSTATYPISIEIELLFADLTTLGGPEAAAEMRIDPDLIEFQSVSRRKLKLNWNSATNFPEFVPVLFDEFHFSLLRLHFFTATVDVRKRLRNGFGLVIEEDESAENASNFKNFLGNAGQDKLFSDGEICDALSVAVAAGGGGSGGNGQNTTIRAGTASSSAEHSTTSGTTTADTTRTFSAQLSREKLILESALQHLEQVSHRLLGTTSTATRNGGSSSSSSKGRNFLNVNNQRTLSLGSTASAQNRGEQLVNLMRVKSTAADSSLASGASLTLNSSPSAGGTSGTTSSSLFRVENHREIFDHHIPDEQHNLTFSSQEEEEDRQFYNGGGTSTHSRQQEEHDVDGNARGTQRALAAKRRKEDLVELDALRQKLSTLWYDHFLSKVPHYNYKIFSFLQTIHAANIRKFWANRVFREDVEIFGESGLDRASTSSSSGKKAGNSINDNGENLVLDDRQDRNLRSTCSSPARRAAKLELWHVRPSALDDETEAESFVEQKRQQLAQRDPAVPSEFQIDDLSFSNSLGHPLIFEQRYYRQTRSSSLLQRAANGQDGGRALQDPASRKMLNAHSDESETETSMRNKIISSSDCNNTIDDHSVTQVIQHGHGGNMMTASSSSSASVVRTPVVKSVSSPITFDHGKNRSLTSLASPARTDFLFTHNTTTTSSNNSTPAAANNTRSTKNYSTAPSAAGASYSHIHNPAAVTTIPEATSSAAKVDERTSSTTPAAAEVLSEIISADQNTTSGSARPKRKVARGDGGEDQVVDRAGHAAEEETARVDGRHEEDAGSITDHAAARDKNINPDSVVLVGDGAAGSSRVRGATKQSEAGDTLKDEEVGSGTQAVPDDSEVVDHDRTSGKTTKSKNVEPATAATSSDHSFLGTSAKELLDAISTSTGEQVQSRQTTKRVVSDQREGEVGLREMNMLQPRSHEDPKLLHQDGSHRAAALLDDDYDLHGGAVNLDTEKTLRHHGDKQETASSSRVQRHENMVSDALFVSADNIAQPERSTSSTSEMMSEKNTTNYSFSDFHLHHSSPLPPAGSHLIVLVHGLHGNPYDLRMIKNAIVVQFPEVFFLCSSSNEDQTEGDISAMGERLFEEVDSFACDNCGGIPDRLSFVGHSMGGLIIRSAIPLLRHKYGRSFHSYISLSTMHLGLNYTGQNRLVEAGVWVLKKWRQSEALRQLSLSDDYNLKVDHHSSRATDRGHLLQMNHDDDVDDLQEQHTKAETASRRRRTGEGQHLQGSFSAFSSRRSTPTMNILRNSFLYQLSLHSSLELFKHVVFLSSKQDQYSPYESARCEVPPPPPGVEQTDNYTSARTSTRAQQQQASGTSNHRAHQDGQTNDPDLSNDIDRRVDDLQPHLAIPVGTPPTATSVGPDEPRVVEEEDPRTEIELLTEEMARNLLQKVKPEKLLRLNVNFFIAEQSLDSIIGRAAHIQFLENQTLMKMIVTHYPYLFA
ncbi:unnamed protein product [Amoebophrya sp. A120]|nr:unnamed protein product [Amoebophrya sp. A120]|eukprot:GSA120T00014804001.1